MIQTLKQGQDDLDRICLHQKDSKGLVQTGPVVFSLEVAPEHLRELQCDLARISNFQAWRQQRYVRHTSENSAQINKGVYRRRILSQKACQMLPRCFRGSVCHELIQGAVHAPCGHSFCQVWRGFCFVSNGIIGKSSESTRQIQQKVLLPVHSLAWMALQVHLQGEAGSHNELVTWQRKTYPFKSFLFSSKSFENFSRKSKLSAFESSRIAASPWSERVKRWQP